MYVRNVCKATLLVVLLALVGIVPLFAGGQPEIITFPDTELGFAYIPQQEFEIEGSIEMAQLSSVDAEYFIVADYGQNQGSCGGGAYGRCVVNPSDSNDLIQYELRNSDGSVIRDLADVTDSSQVITGIAPAGSGFLGFATFAATLSIYVPAGQLTDSNPAYEDNMTMRFYYGSIDDPNSYDPAQPDATATLTVLGNVTPFIEVVLVDPGAPFPFFGGTTQRTMDFGVLQAGDTRQYDLLVETNALFSMDIASQNSGVLTYQGSNPVGGLPTEVDYELYVDGQTVNLDTGSATFGSGLSGLRWPFLVEILDYGVPVAGQYQDIIDITVTTDQ